MNWRAKAAELINRHGRMAEVGADPKELKNFCGANLG
jgi:hypothetical protein